MSMRCLLVTVLAVGLALPVLAQQHQSTPEQPQQSQPPKKPVKQPQQPNQEQPAAKPTEPAPQPEPKPGDDKKEEHYDMTEVAPVVTHHEVKLEGKTLKYTATAGRLPIKR